MTDRGRLPTAAVAGLLVLVGILLLVRAFDGTPSIGGDNAGYLILARSLLEGEGLRDLYLPGAPLHTKYPPLYPLLLAGWMALGAETWTRFQLLSALLVLAASVAVLLWAARRRGLYFGFGLAFLLLLSPAFHDAASDILSDPLFLLLTFGALWAAERAGVLRARDGGPGATGSRAGDSGDSDDSDDSGDSDGVLGAAGGFWLVLAGLAAILAWWTRSAGLPLVLALGGVLLIRRRWRAAAAFGLAFLLPAALWWLRGRGVGADAGGYLAELWMVNPYRPELGTVGLAGMLGRALENLVRYGTLWIPQGLTGGQGGWVALLGVVLCGLAAAGWLRALRRGAGVTELFLPLYFGLLLAWPEVWASQRFALPLLPLVLLYAGGALGDAVTWLEARRGGEDPGARGGEDPRARGREDPRARGRWAGPAVATVAALLLLAPAGAAWWERGHVTSFCRAAAESAGPFGCYGAPVQEYAAAALWSGANLADDAVVLTRKPRIFHVLSGLRADVFPFTDRPDAFLDTARVAGATHVLADYVDAQASRYLVPVILERPALFCTVRGFGADPSARTHLLGVVGDSTGTDGAAVGAPPAAADEAATADEADEAATADEADEADEDGRVSLGACPRPDDGSPPPEEPRAAGGPGAARTGPAGERIPDLTDPRIPFLSRPVRRAPVRRAP